MNHLRVCSPQFEGLACGSCGTDDTFQGEDSLLKLMVSEMEKQKRLQCDLQYILFKMFSFCVPLTLR